MKQDANLLDKADDIAERRHHGTCRKFTGEPYIQHPRRVMALCQAAGCDMSQQVAALLHDLLEDTPTKEAELREQFGDHITDIVVALTRRDGETYDQFVTRTMRNPWARQVKLADILDNLSTIPAGHTLAMRYVKAAMRVAFGGGE